MSGLVASVLFNSFWIVGLALLLAAFSYHYDRAQQKQSSLREQLGSRSFVFAAWIGAVLIGVGLIGTSARIWEGVVWFAFTVYALLKVIQLWRLRLAEPSDEMSTSDQGN